MKRFILMLVFLFVCVSFSFAADEKSPYVYSFPKAPADWGNAAAFGNLSPGFFQVMYQNKAGIVRIATYGIVGASMDNLRDPQLMMVFAFDQKASAAGGIKEEKLANRVE